MHTKTLAALLLSTVNSTLAGPVSTPFGVSLQADGYPVLVLSYATTGDASKPHQVVFERPSAYTSVKSYIDGGANNDVFLNYYSYDNALYSVFFEEVGDAYGTRTPVYGLSGTDQGRAGWSVTNTTNGVLSARLDAALEHFFACNTTINGEGYLGLYWGVYNSTGNDGLQPPADCVAATLRAYTYDQ